VGLRNLDGVCWEVGGCDNSGDAFLLKFAVIT